MAEKVVRRTVGSLAVWAVAAGFAVAAGAGHAAAAPGSITWADGNSKFTRTISNVTPTEGETITVQTTFERTAIPFEIIQEIKDLHPACLTPVAGSTKMSGDAVSIDSSGPDWIKVKLGLTKYAVYPNIEPKSRTFEVQYKVGNCVRDTALPTSMHYSGSLGEGVYQDKGPAITVARNTTGVTLTAPATAKVGTAVSLSAVVTGAHAGDTVEFLDGGTVVGSGTVDAAGAVSASWTPSTAGTRTLTARYGATAWALGSVSPARSVKVESVDGGGTPGGGETPGGGTGTGSFGF
ncbi:Ig-like domain-containing protein [Nocardia thailandica]|uniref:Ig-like domain-containing protein n=1 Tax=Nocardia thailandica TaxID=257275 RepID=UPI000302E063|nr:Ig-like domain-containing protein [Nocardia thailandica]